MLAIACLFGLSVLLDGGQAMQERTLEYVTATQNDQLYLPEEDNTDYTWGLPDATPQSTAARRSLNGVLEIRGIRNNNPGNIVRSSNRRWHNRVPFAQSTDRKFEQFNAMEDGMAALIRLIYDYKFNWGDPTIKTMSVRYCPEAPGSDNWAREVSGFSGIPINEDYDWTLDNVENLVKGIITLECGHAAWDQVSWYFDDAFMKYRVADSSLVL